MADGTPSRTWVNDAVARLAADVQRSADTHLITFPLPASWGIDLYLKDESTHPTGSLKHRLARSLFLYGLCNGWIGEGTTIVESSSGSTAVSEAYFARMLGLPFVAVMPRATSPEKVAMIEHYGGRCHLVDDATTVSEISREVAAACGGHYMDQFTYAERATDWRGNNNIAESMFEQLALERHPVPAWIVTGAGTGGTSATIGRYVRYRQYPTRVCVVDPEGSVFADYFATGDAERARPGLALEGIGRPRVEPSFVPDRHRPRRARAGHGVVRGDARAVALVAPRGRRLDRYRVLRRACASWPRCSTPASRVRSSRSSATRVSATATRTTTTPGWRRKAAASSP